MREREGQGQGPEDEREGGSGSRAQRMRERERRGVEFGEKDFFFLSYYRGSGLCLSSKENELKLLPCETGQASQLWTFSLSNIDSR